ncbi:phage tail protein [Sphingosinicella microcystinivorans]|uniref:phage tail protein n=1 Tax=Sphingosinicella microcystinivorans TaxID=335406 RepID=UPI0022F3E8B1|nr:phage tail protein [Sphingosinicella microcystinivorans]WBX85710.1 phage tail protein [Sphingosinicella microcystinivorans]
MATLVLTTVGAIVGGPIGAGLGAIAGNSIDRMLFAPKGRTGPRLDDLTVQSSAYGLPHPRLYGTTRAAGNVIWSRGLRETAHRSGGGKRSGGRTTTYSYSASFAVAVSARPIAGIGRIWADGKLLRGAGGEMTAEGTVRIYTGGETQAPDPLITAAEGPANAPSYRGLAYVVFEDLQLGDFANRIPNLSFEVVSDAAPPTLGAILNDLAEAAGVRISTGGLSASLPGFAAATNAPLSTWVRSLGELGEMRAIADRHVRLHDESTDTGIVLDDDLIAEGENRHSIARRSGDAPASVTFGYLDIARDYQAGTQRAFRPGAQGREDHSELPVALSAGAAKRAAQTLLQRLWTQRETAEFRLGYRALSLQPGDRLRDRDGRRWEIRRTSLEAMTVALEAEPVNPDGGVDAAADAGRAETGGDAPQGETQFHAFELPPIAGDAPTAPRLWIAAAGTGSGWRRAEIWLSGDAGASWSSIGMASGGVPMGTALSTLPAADPTRWDEIAALDVELLSDAMWLESRPALSVLAGANLALAGDELIQFRSAVPIAPRRFRLSGLLRGRKATEAAMAAHVPGERFVLLETPGLFPIDLSTDAVGTDVAVRVVPPNASVADSPQTVHRVTGRALQPLSPVHGAARVLADGAVAFSWTRRSRTGFGWIDGVDAPLGEERERYAVRCSVGAAAVADEVGEAAWTLAAGAQTAAFGMLPGAVHLEVRQLSAAVGAGAPLSADFILNR